MLPKTDIDSELYRHVMLDIETLDTKPSSVILSIGAVGLRDLNVSFYNELIIEQPDRTLSADTLNWWISQERSGIRIPNHGNVGLTKALFDLREWLVSEFSEDVVVWCKGTDFDVTILSNAYRKAYINLPWKYNNVRDCRTVFKLFHLDEKEKPFNFSKHHALSDAKNQAMQLLAIRRKYDFRLA